jgi:preprotein translocase subunit YajC
MKKNSAVVDILMLGALAGIAYYVSRQYNKKKQKEREMRESLHFQLF